MAQPNDFPVQFQGSALARRILKLLGWQVHFRGLPALHGVIVVYPHTSNWDFPVGLLAKWAMGLEAKFLGKHTLFRIPLFGAWLRWLGGVPVDRRAAGGVVEQMVEMFARKKSAGEYFWLALTPEGTRSWRPAWRSGFYRVTLSAQLPLMLAVLDYGRKEVRVVDAMTLSGQVDEDMRRIAQAFEGCRGLRQELAAPIRLETGKERQ
jgi:1-acyl-sn-glycerol-3-phosphate acyltransferase